MLLSAADTTPTQTIRRVNKSNIYNILFFEMITPHIKNLILILRINKRFFKIFILLKSHQLNRKYILSIFNKY